MKKRLCINTEQGTTYYEQTVEAETEEEAIEKANDEWDWEKVHFSWNWDSETEAREIE